MLDAFDGANSCYLWPIFKVSVSVMTNLLAGLNRPWTRFKRIDRIVRIDRIHGIEATKNASLISMGMNPIYELCFFGKYPIDIWG